MIELEQARHRLEELGMWQAAQLLEAILEAASRSQNTYLSFLNELLEAELQERQRRNVEVRMKLSHLPYRRTLSEFDFSFQPGIDERLIRELAGLTFIGRHENVLFLGPPGVGKTLGCCYCHGSHWARIAGLFCLSHAAHQRFEESI